MATYEYTLTLSNEDAEESSGSMSLTSSAFDIGQNECGVTFPLNVAQYSTITNAFIRFTSRSNYSDLCQVNFQAQLIDDAPEWTSTSNNITTRTPLTAAYSRTLPAWSAESTYTVDIADILQEIVNQADWVANGRVALIITGSSGRRSAYTYDNDPAKAAYIYVDYTGTTYPGHGSIRAGIRLGGTATSSAEHEATGAMRSAMRLGGSPSLETTFSATGASRNAMRLGGVPLLGADFPAIGAMRAGVRLGGVAFVGNSKPYYYPPARMANTKMVY